jgi:hypothetical protein
MKPRPLAVTVCLLATFASVAIAGPEWPQGISKGTILVLKIPVPALAGFREGTSSVGALIYGVEVERVLANPGWRGQSFPVMANFAVEKINEWKSPAGAKLTQIEIRNPAIWVKLRLDPTKDVGARLREVVAVQNIDQFKESEYFRKEVFDVLDPQIFVGPLAGLPFKLKLALLDFVHFNKEAITAGTYKGKSYLSVDLGDSGDVYNSLRLDQAARVARVINEKYLGLIKTFSSVAEQVGIEGIKLITVIQHKSFLDELATPSRDHLEVYVPLDKAQQFNNAEITSQQLMDASVILLNDNRIQAVLTSSAS